MGNKCFAGREDAAGVDADRRGKHEIAQGALDIVYVK